MDSPARQNTSPTYYIHAYYFAYDKLKKHKVFFPRERTEKERPNQTNTPYLPTHRDACTFIERPQSVNGERTLVSHAPHATRRSLSFQPPSRQHPTHIHTRSIHHRSKKFCVCVSLLHVLTHFTPTQFYCTLSCLPAHCARGKRGPSSIIRTRGARRSHAASGSSLAWGSWTMPQKTTPSPSRCAP